MTTYTSTAVIDHSSDAGFRAWVADFIAMVVAAGLVQTADTGQINTATATRPGTGIAAGYAIFRLPDSSLYFKIEFGTNTSATSPAFWMTVGEGSNGSGTLTGALSTRSLMSINGVPSSTVTPYTSYVCVTNDFFGMCFKAGGRGGSVGKAVGTFCVGKTVDNTGAATSLGYYVIRPQSTTQMNLQCVRRAATSVTYTESNSFCVVPGLAGSSPPNSQDANGDLQIYTHWGQFPTVLPLLYSVTVRAAEFVELNSFVATMVGSTPHTYLFIGTNANTCESTGNSSNQHMLAFLWE